MWAKCCDGKKLTPKLCDLASTSKGSTGMLQDTSVSRTHIATLVKCMGLNITVEICKCIIRMWNVISENLHVSIK